MILVVGWWGSRSRPGPAGAGPAVRRCGAGRCGSPSHTLALDFHSREQSSGQRQHHIQHRHQHPATSQFLRVQPAAVTPLDNSITRPPHPGHAAPVADSSAVLAPVPVRPRLISRGHCWQDGAGVCCQEWGQQQPSPGSMSVNGSLSVYSPTPTKVNTATRH